MPNVLAIGDVRVQALSDSHIKKADAIGAALSVAVGIGGSISVAASIVDNLIRNDVRAYLESTGTTTKIIRAGDDVSVTANARQARIADISAVTASVSVGLFGVSGGGVDIDNVIDNTVEAHIRGAALSVLALGVTADPDGEDRPGNVTVSANENAYLEADATNVTISVSLGAALGVSLLSNTVSSDIIASVQNATVGSSNTTILANSFADVSKNKTTAVSGSLVAATGNRADTDIATLVKAYTDHATLVSTGEVLISANADNKARASATVARSARLPSEQ